MTSCRKFFLRTSNIIKRLYATEKKRAIIELDADTHDKIERNELKARRHPGIVPRHVRLPPHLEAAALASLGDTPPRALQTECKRLAAHLQGRHPPPEQWQILEKRARAEGRIAPKFNIDFSKRGTEEVDKAMQEYDRQLRKAMKSDVYQWKAIAYDSHESLKYLVGRAAPEYAVLYRIFNEIKARDPDFIPKTFFDFGSGVGTGTWALRECWNNHLDEYFTVDVSSEMNDLSKNILAEAYADDPIPEVKYFQRQFLPTIPRPYDLVISSYTLFELPSAQSRLETVFNLWKKTEGYMVLVEQGTNNGYNLINEARDFILEMKGPHKGHVFSPCPHDSSCPRMTTDRTPCNFEISYDDLKLTKRVENCTEYFSYVVLRKGERAENELAWPRIVRPVLERTGHTICRMCCANGKLQEVIVTKSKHGKIASRCAKASSWGDRFPIKIINPPPSDAT